MILDLVTTNSTIKKIQKGQPGMLSDMQIMNYIVNTQDAKRLLDPETYKRVEDIFWAYSKRTNKTEYRSEVDFLDRAAEIACDFFFVARYSDISGSTPPGTVFYIERSLSNYQQSMDKMYDMMTGTIDKIRDSIVKNQLPVKNVEDIYCIAVTYYAIILSIIVNNNSNPDMMSVHKLMRSLTHENKRDVVAWKAHYLFEHTVEKNYGNRHMDPGEVTWSTRAADLLHDYTEIMPQKIPVSNKIGMISNRFLFHCGIENPNLEIIKAIEDFQQFCAGFLTE